MEAFIVYSVPIIGLVTIAVLLIIFGYKESRYRKKIEFLEKVIDKGYETENIDLNKL